jgi:hypothetical protein
MTGADLYSMWQDQMDLQKINTRPWEQLPDRLRNAWNGLADDVMERVA